MTAFYKSSNKTNAQIFEARGNNDARLYVESDNGKLIWACVGSQRTGTWMIGSGGLQTIGDLRRIFWRLHNWRKTA